MSDLSPEAKAILDAGLAADEPTVADRDRVRRAIAMRVGVGLAAGTAIGTATAKAAAVTSAQVGTAAGTAASATVAGSAAAAGAKVAASSVAAKLIVGVALVGGGGAAIYEAQKPAAPPVATVSVIDRPQARVIPSTPAQMREPPVAPAIAETVEAPEPVAQNVLTTNEAPPAEAVKKPAAPALAAPAKAVVAKPAASSLAEEARLMQEANAAMQGGRAGEALARLAEHERSYPNGILAEERTAQRVLALCADGRGAEAKSVATTFLSRWPRSPYVARIEASCASSTTP